MIKSVNRRLTLLAPNIEVTIIGGGGYLPEGVMRGGGG